MNRALRGSRGSSRSAFGRKTMSIYATLWKLKFPKEGDEYLGCDWIEVTAQGVPPHIGTPTPGQGYEDGDPYADFLPPPVETDADTSTCTPFARTCAGRRRLADILWSRSPRRRSWGPPEANHRISRYSQPNSRLADIR